MAKLNLFQVVSTLNIIESNRLWSMWTCQPSNSRLKRWNHTEVGILFLLAWYKLCVCISINSWIFYFKMLYVCGSRHGQLYINQYETDSSNGITIKYKNIELKIIKSTLLYFHLLIIFLSYFIFSKRNSESSVVWMQQNIYAFLIT